MTSQNTCLSTSALMAWGCAPLLVMSWVNVATAAAEQKARLSDLSREQSHVIDVHPTHGPLVVSGTLVLATDRELVLSQAGVTTVWPASEILSVSRDHRSTAKGLFIGLGIGILMGWGYSQTRDYECGRGCGAAGGNAMALSFAGIGAAIGYWHKGTHVLYRAPHPNP
jgi:hypothetical protein